MGGGAKGRSEIRLTRYLNVLKLSNEYRGVHYNISCTFIYMLNFPYLEFLMKRTNGEMGIFKGL